MVHTMHVQNHFVSQIMKQTCSYIMAVMLRQNKFEKVLVPACHWSLPLVTVLLSMLARIWWAVP